MAERGAKTTSNHRTWSSHYIVMHFPEYRESVHNTVLLYKLLHHTIYIAPSEIIPSMLTIHIINNNNKFKLSHDGPAWQPLSCEKRMYFGQSCRGHFEVVIYLCQAHSHPHQQTESLELAYSIHYSGHPNPKSLFTQSWSKPPKICSKWRPLRASWV